MKKRILSLVVYSLCLVGCTQTASTPPLGSFDARGIDIGEDVYAVVVLGGGIGGYTAALYSGLANLEPLVIEGPTPGGLLTQSHSVRNFPTVLDSSGHEIMDTMRKQVIARGAKLLAHKVTAVDFSQWPYQIKTESVTGLDSPKTIKALSVIIAMGAQNRYLGIPGEEKYWSAGVSNCAVCDGALYKDKDVVIVGGGDSAMVEASYLSRLCKSVTILVRRNTLRAQDSRRDEVQALPNVTFRFTTKIQEILGDGDGVTHIMVQDAKKRGPEKLKVDGVFLAIGFDPNTSYFKNQLKLDSRGYIIVDKDTQASLPGVYAIGDGADDEYKQAVTAAGDGCKAALRAQAFLHDIHYRTDEQLRQVDVSQKKDETRAPVVNEVVHVNSQAKFNELVKGSLPVMVDFYADWCGPCKRLTPTLKKLAMEFAGRVIIAKVNIDNLGSISRNYGVRSIPAVFSFKNGKLMNKSVGFKSYGELKKVVERLVR